MISDDNVENKTEKTNHKSLELTERSNYFEKYKSLRVNPTFFYLESLTL